MRSRRIERAVDARTHAHIAALACLSRLSVLLLAVVSDLLLPDHQPTGVLVERFDAKCGAAAVLRPFTRWDSAHFLNVAQHGWRDDWNFAFFPLYPILLRAGAAALAGLRLPLCPQERLVLGGVLLSNAAFVAAACCLHALTLAVLRDRDIARRATLLFCLSPASAFFSSLYTESAFALATFGGFLLFERGGRALAAALLLCAASALRANGLLNAIVVVAHAAIAASAASQPAAPRDEGAAACAAGTSSSRARWRAVCVQAACSSVYCGLQLTLVLAPYVGWAAFAYSRFCSSAATATATATATTTTAAAAAAPTTPPRWCDGPLPDIYGHVQRTYWNVGPLRYFQMRQLPNFALATPALLLCAMGCNATVSALRRAATARAAAEAPADTTTATSTDTGASPRRDLDGAGANCGAPTRRSVAWHAMRLVLRMPASAAAAASDAHARAARGNGGGGPSASLPSAKDGGRCEGDDDGSGSEARHVMATTPQTVAFAYDEAATGAARAAPYVAHWACLSLLALLVSNVQVTTRLVAAGCPPLYWQLASLMRAADGSGAAGDGAGGAAGGAAGGGAGGGAGGAGGGGADAAGGVGSASEAGAAPCAGGAGYAGAGARSVGTLRASSVRRLWSAYVLGFALGGTVLHANFFPWT